MASCETCGAIFRPRIGKAGRFCSRKCIRGSHGMFGSRFYNKWAGMKQRCTNPKNPKWTRYGGRGIRICESWMTFERFRDDMYASYQEFCAANGERNTQIDRRNNEGNYDPSNCHWVTPRGNSLNRSISHLLTFNGKTQTIKEWANELGFGDWNIHNRLHKYGWSAEKALSTPIRFCRTRRIVTKKYNSL